MTHYRTRPACAIAVTVATLLPALCHGEATGTSLEDRLRRLEERQAQLERENAEKDRRIEALERERADVIEPVEPPSPHQASPPSGASPAGAAPSLAVAPAASPDGHERFGRYTPRYGFTVADTDSGRMNVKLLTYVRYLNQTGLEDTFTDSFGVTSPIDLRQDTQLNKATIQVNGWVIDPDFKYLLYTWTSNASQGQGAQVVVAGNLTYVFNKHFTLGAGVNALPGVRSTEGSYPLWLSIDNRTIADEFMRPSFTQGLWARGYITDKLEYYAMVGNNLSTLGVDASQLDNDLNTWSARLAWLPTTGEFGSHQSAYGDYDWHEEVATRFGIHFTRSGEDAQSAPNTDSFENVTIRLSDGNSIFEPNLFAPGTTITHATYEMASLEAAAKYRGMSLEGEYYWRKVDRFRGPGTDALDDLNDTGFQLQASAMLVPKLLMLYGGYSKVYGEHGDPWDARIGINVYPFRNQVVRWNTEVLYLDRSPVGGLSLPYPVGGDGYVFYSNVLLDL